MIPKIKECRKRAGLSQKELAEITGINASHLSAYENGKVYPSLMNLWIIADALNCLVDDLYEKG